MADIVSLFGDTPVADLRAELERLDAALKAAIKNAGDSGVPAGMIVAMIAVHMHRETAYLASEEDA